MKIFTAHVHPRKLPVLVPEGFSAGGFLFGPLWLLASSAWIAGLIALAALVLCCTVLPPSLRPVFAFALFVAVGLFGHDLHRWSLALGGYRLAHVVTGRTQDEAFFRLLSTQTGLAASAV